MGDCEGDKEGVGVGEGEGGKVGGSVGSSSSIPVEKERNTSFPSLTCTQLVFVISSFKWCSLLYLLDVA